MLVVIHDVAPLFIRQVAKIVDQLLPFRLPLAAAVVPCWHGLRLEAGDKEFIDLVKTSFDEILLHGFTHRREHGQGWVSRLTGAADEFSGLSRTEASRRLSFGQGILGDVFGRRAKGFIAPAWQRGPVDVSLLLRHDLHYAMDFSSILCGQQKIPLAQMTWDVGKVELFNALAGKITVLISRNRPSAIPCFAIHPLDVDRGFLMSIVRAVEGCLLKEYRPLRLETLLSTATP